MRQVGGKAVPQYFVMVGGGTTAAGASFARTAAKIPARRIPEAVERLIAFYARRSRTASRPRRSSSGSICRRSTALLNDLQHLTPEDVTADDFVDLAETAEFAPEVMDGECSA